jgi:hypothetical protein
MECPSCETNFFPQMQSQHIGENGKGFYGILYWLNCPNCKEFIIYLKQTRNRIEATAALATNFSGFEEKEVGKEAAIILFPR